MSSARSAISCNGALDAEMLGDRGASARRASFLFGEHAHLQIHVGAVIGVAPGDSGSQSRTASKDHLGTDDGRQQMKGNGSNGCSPGRRYSRGSSPEPGQVDHDRARRARETCHPVADTRKPRAACGTDYWAARSCGCSPRVCRSREPGYTVVGRCADPTARGTRAPCGR